MSKKKIAAFICGGIGIVGLLGLFKEFSGGLLGGSLVLIAVGALLFLLDKPKKTTTEQPLQEKPKEAPTIKKEVSNLDLYVIKDEFVLRYRYDISLENPDALAAQGNTGKQVSFEENSVMLDGKKLGEVPAWMGEMVADYTRRDDPISAFIHIVSADEISLKVGFYKSDKELQTKDYKVSGKKYTEYRELCEVGDIVTASQDYIEPSNDYDTGRDVALITTLRGDDIGVLPASACDELNFKHVIAGKIIDLDGSKCTVRLFI